MFHQNGWHLNSNLSYFHIPSSFFNRFSLSFFIQVSIPLLIFQLKLSFHFCLSICPTLIYQYFSSFKFVCPYVCLYSLLVFLSCPLSCRSLNLFASVLYSLSVCLFISLFIHNFISTILPGTFSMFLSFFLSFFLVFQIYFFHLRPSLIHSTP